MLPRSHRSGSEHVKAACNGRGGSASASAGGSRASGDGMLMCPTKP